MIQLFSLTESTENTEVFGEHRSVISREGAKTRRLEGECLHEPPSAVRKDDSRFHRGSVGRDERLLVRAAVTPPLL